MRNRLRKYNREQAMTGRGDDSCSFLASPSLAAMTLIATVAVPAFAPAALHADELETTHLFGFTLGTDVNDVGQKEAELENTGRFGKSDGSYAAVSSEFGLKFIPFKNFSIEPEVSAAYDGISGVPGLDDRQQLAFESLTFETRYRLLDRTHAPFGLTLGLDPHLGFIDDISGAPVDQYGAQFLVAADKELVEKRIFAALNLLYEPDATRSRITGGWEHQSDVGISAGLTAQTASGIFIGAEARYLRSYDGLALDAFTGNALFAGPTFYWKISELYWMSAAWSVQVAGRAADGMGSLDLTNFERHQVVLRFGYNF
jgi:hypothetical protein